MCQNNSCGCDNPRIFIEEVKPIDINTQLAIQGVFPVEVTKSKTGDFTTYTVTAELSGGSNGKDGKDGVNGTNGVNGISPTIQIGNVTQGDNAQVTNTGTASNVILNYVLPKGAKGNDGINGVNGINGTNGLNGSNGTNGITAGIKAYYLANGGSYTSYSPVGNFQQGNYVDLGDNTSKKIRIKAWVTIANMQNWTTLRLVSSNTPGFSGTLISQRIKHSEATLYTGQHEINAYIETTDRYIGFTFSDTPGGNYNSDGEQYGDYAIEVFVLN